MNIKRLLINIIVIIIVCVSGAVIYYIVRDKPLIDSYTACGCGGCGGAEPTIKYLYESRGGRKELDDAISTDKDRAHSHSCIYTGCSICIEYRLVDDRLWH